MTLLDISARLVFPDLHDLLLGSRPHLVRALNWMHGIKSQEAWTDAVRLGLHVILSGLPFLWFCFVGFSAPAPFWWDWPLPLNYLFAAYLWLIGILWTGALSHCLGHLSASP